MDMDNGLNLPGTIPGLLRRGSPVILINSTSYDSYWYGQPGASGVVHRIDQEGIETALNDVTDGDALVSTLDSDLVLDLADATGRAHAAWWLAKAQPAYHLPRWQPIETVSFIAGSYGWCLMGMRENHLGWGWKRHPGGQHVGMLPHSLDCLADLDPSDKLLLPDGSRWVDAEALRRIILYTLELSHGQC